MWHLLSASHRVHPAALRETTTDSGGVSNHCWISGNSTHCGIWTPGLEEQHSKWNSARITPHCSAWEESCKERMLSLSLFKGACSQRQCLFSHWAGAKMCTPSTVVGAAGNFSQWGRGESPESQGRLWKGPTVQNLSPRCTQVSFHVHLFLFSDKARTVHYLHVLGCLL